jgi:hypothetical protein
MDFPLVPNTHVPIGIMTNAKRANHFNLFSLQIIFIQDQHNYPTQKHI